MGYGVVLLPSLSGFSLEDKISRLESAVNDLRRDVSKIRADVDHVRERRESDVRWLFIWTTGFILLVLYIMAAKGFGWI